MKYEMFKSFDCQEMPPDVRSCFFEVNGMIENDIWVSWRVGTDAYGNKEYRYLVDQWLVMNGALDGELVLINHWW